MAQAIELGTLSSGATVSLVKDGASGWGIQIVDDVAGVISQMPPVRVEVSIAGSVRQLASGYDDVAVSDGAAQCCARLFDGDITFVVDDRWTLQASALDMVRTLRVDGDAPGGFASGIWLRTGADVTWPDVDFFAPGLLYGDPAHDGDRSPGGVLHYEARRFAIRGDYLAAPLFAFSLRNGRSLAVLHRDPRGNTTMQETQEPAGPTLIDERFQFGAVGARETSAGGIEFGFWLPGSV